MIKLNLFNNYGPLDFDPKKNLKKVVKAIKKIEQIKNKHVVSFILVNDEEIHSINKQYRNIDRPTDVISFANIDSSEDGILPYELGDIFISIDKTKEQAKSYEHSFLREFCFLACHGMLHLLGYDHQNPEDEKELIAKQKLVMKRIGLEKEV
jgi:probable rRNA maturation factor